MLNFTVVHKYCGYTKNITGCNVWDAFKKNNLDFKIWQLLNIEKING